VCVCCDVHFLDFVKDLGGRRILKVASKMMKKLKKMDPKYPQLHNI